MVLETAAVQRPDATQHNNNTAETHDWSRAAQTLSDYYSISARPLGRDRPVEHNSFTPNLELGDRDERIANRGRVQEYSAAIRSEWDNIDTRKRGIIDKDDLDRYIANPANASHRDMAQFYRDNFDLVSGIAYEPITNESELFMGYGIYKKDVDKLEALTDPAKFRSLVRWDSFSQVSAFVGAMGTVVGGLGASAVAMEGAKTLAGLLAVGLASGVAIAGAAVAVGTAAGLGVGYLFYQAKVREHYSAKRAELESRMHSR